MKLNIDPEKCWEAPEGVFEATLDEIREVTDKHTSKRKLRLVFRLDDYSSPYKVTLVAKNFEPTLAPGSDLREFLLSWLGEEVMREHIEKGTFDFDLLTERKAVLQVIHHHNESHTKPYVMIQSIHPPQVGKYEHSGDGI